MDIEIIVEIVGIVVNVVGLIIAVISILKDRNETASNEVNISLTSNNSIKQQSDNVNSFNTIQQQNIYYGPQKQDGGDAVYVFLIIIFFVGIVFEKYISLIFLLITITGFILILMRQCGKALYLIKQKQWIINLFLLEPFIVTGLYYLSNYIFYSLAETNSSQIVNKFFTAFFVGISIFICVCLLVLQLCCVLLPRIKVTWLQRYMLKLVELWYLPMASAILEVLYAVLMSICNG